MNGDTRHILYVAEFTTGGSVESLHSLVSGLDKTRYETTVLFYVDPGTDTRQRFEHAGATVLTLMPGEDTGSPAGLGIRMGLQTRIRKLFGRHVEGVYATLKYFLLFLRQKLPIFFALRRRLKSMPVDLVHFNNGLASDTVGILAAAACGLPSVCHVRAFAVHAPPQVWAARFVTDFLCVSKAIRDHLVDAGVDPAKASVCYDSVNQERFHETDVDRAGLLAEFGFDAADHVFGLIGRLDLWKGHPYFIDAIGIARQHNASIRGLVVGGAADSPHHRDYVDSLHARVEELGISGAVAFAGHRTDIPDIIQSLDAVVCASSSPEPFGLMVVESMAVGTPVIATDAGGPAEMITDRIDGLLVPIRDPAAMAEAMLHIAGNPDEAAEFVAAGRKTVASRFTVAHHVDTVCGVYDEVLGHGRA